MKHDQELQQIAQQIFELQKKRRELFEQSEGEVVENYIFRTADGDPIHLSDLFGDKNDLILVHNMGKECSYCTLWADGFNGLNQHLADRAGFVVGSPNEPEDMKRFAESRHWRFKMVSVDKQFASDMGMYNENDGFWPGVSTFKKLPDGTIKRMNWSFLGPGDPFCSLWHLFDMIPEGDNGWEPKYRY